MGAQAPDPAQAELAARCEPIELLVVDVDGVLTDGVITVDDHGVETKHFHVRDGLAYAVWHGAGKRAAILSGRRAAAVEEREDKGTLLVLKQLLKAATTFTLLLGCYLGYVRAFAILVESLREARPREGVLFLVKTSKSKEKALALAKAAVGADHWSVTND